MRGRLDQSWRRQGPSAHHSIYFRFRTVLQCSRHPWMAMLYVPKNQGSLSGLGSHED